MYIFDTDYAYAPFDAQCTLLSRCYFRVIGITSIHIVMHDAYLLVFWVKIVVLWSLYRPLHLLCPMHNAYFGFRWNFYYVGTFHCCVATLEYGEPMCTMHINMHDAFLWCGYLSFLCDNSRLWCTYCARCIFCFLVYFYDVGTFHCCVFTLEYGEPIMHNAFHYAQCIFCLRCFFVLWVPFIVVWSL